LSSNIIFALPILCCFNSVIANVAITVLHVSYVNMYKYPYLINIKCSSRIFTGCILLCVSTIYEFCFSCQTQQYTKQLAHTSLCITEFIDCTVSKHVSAHGSIISQYGNKSDTTELCLLYGSIYCTYCALLSLLFITFVLLQSVISWTVVLSRHITRYSHISMSSLKIVAVDHYASVPTLV
jgi:hypothetical protein